MSCKYCNGLGMIYVFVGWQECPACSGSDPEIFCEVCAAGMGSSEHQEKCLTTPSLTERL